jgi:exopolysaccharide biosynthesis polyprenyl glycosylphosphotransferase
MSEMTTNRLWDTGPTSNSSPYARMIPGTGAVPPPRAFAATPSSTKPFAPAPPAQENEATGLPSERTRGPRWPISTHIDLDRFTLYELVAADLSVVVLAGAATNFLFPHWGVPWAYLPVFAVLVAFSGFCLGQYKRAGDPSPSGIVASLAKSILLATGLVLISAWREVSVLTACRIFCSNLAGLVLLRRARQIVWRRRREAELRKILIVGGGTVARSIARTLRDDPLHRASVCGFVDNDLPLSPAVLGRIGDLEWLARAEFIDEVILCLPDQPAATREAAEAALRNHLDIRAVPGLPPGLWPDSTIDHIGEVPVVTLHRESMPSASLFLKRWLDIGGAGLGLVLASPLMATVALLIRLDSPGPIFYSAERTGAKGRRFRCYKFRSMVTDAEQRKEDLRAQNQRQGPIFKIDADPRVTRIGRIIRRYSLDELPQLWNVLRGEMSLVGPRPHPIDEVNHYELHQFRRLDVKPGITGLWQITARDCPSFELNMHLDLTYIENWSLRLDLRILASTVRVLFAPEGV